VAQEKILTPRLKPREVAVTGPGPLGKRGLGELPLRPERLDPHCDLLYGSHYYL